MPSDTRRIRRSDALVPALLGIAGTIEILAAGHERTSLELGAYWLAVAALLARRVAPLAVPVVVASIYALAALRAGVSDVASWVLVLPFACLSSGLHAPRSRRPAGLVCVLAALAITVAALRWLTDFDPNVLFGLIWSLGPWGLGIALHEAFDRNRRLGAEAERIRAERALAAQRAAESERRRIAGELHDVLAHTLGAMVVQASVALDQIRREPDAAVATLRAVAQAGRKALAETGRLLRLLRDDHDELGLGPAAEPDAPATASERVTGRIPRSDLLLPALFGAVTTAEVVWYGYAPVAGSLAACWLAVAVLCARRALPLAMPVGVTAIALTARLLGVEVDEPASWILIYALAFSAAGVHVPRSRAAAGLASVVAAIALIAVDAATRGDVGWDGLLLLGVAVAPWAVGVGLRQALERSRELAADAERARLEREIEAERGAAAERRRIARELHDVLANSFSVIVVQASLAADLAVADHDAAAAAAGEVERSGRTALREIGRLLPLIHNDQVGRQPQPGVAELRALADEYARAGLGVELDVDDEVARLPVGVGLSTYRIVQEGLTNALKHAPDSPVRVRLTQQGSEVAIEVHNGHGGSRRLAAIPGGHGLVGLRERAALFGGRVDAGPTADGGFVLAATLPLNPEAE